jgi:hypothetical protein
MRKLLTLVTLLASLAYAVALCSQATQIDSARSRISGGSIDTRYMSVSELAARVGLPKDVTVAILSGKRTEDICQQYYGRLRFLRSKPIRHKAPASEEESDQAVCSFCEEACGLFTNQKRAISCLEACKGRFCRQGH